jgi:hypothetical protein
MAAGATYEPIATQTIAVATTAITFSSIPSTYTDLRLVFVGTQTSGNLDLQFNGDTGSNYSQTYIYGDGSSAASARRNSVSQIQLSEYSAPNATTPSIRYVDIFSYAGNTYKTALNTESQDLNGSGFTLNGVGLWRSTAAITSVSLTVFGAGLLKVGSIATLYGIKAA